MRRETGLVAGHRQKLQILYNYNDLVCPTWYFTQKQAIDLLFSVGQTVQYEALFQIELHQNLVQFDPSSGEQLRFTLATLLGRPLVERFIAAVDVEQGVLAGLNAPVSQVEVVQFALDKKQLLLDQLQIVDRPFSVAEKFAEFVFL